MTEGKRYKWTERRTRRMKDNRKRKEGTNYKTYNFWRQYAASLSFYGHSFLK
jgi:hypothetical protein